MTDETASVEKIPIIYREEKISAYSNLVKREVVVHILLPPTHLEQKFPLLVLNDGQDLKKLKVKESIERLVAEEKIKNVIVAAVVAGDRLQEYGVASQRDYLKRGKLAKVYSKYMITELVPYLLYKYPVDSSPYIHAIAGCSMGGLSAMDIAWNNPNIFKKVGAFSGSFWWRKRDSKSRLYSDARDRLMHQQIKSGKKKEGLQFWFQTGTDDEASDRNKNGVIDSIDDTLDLIVELAKKGYRPFHDIQYLEVKEGKHNLETWAQVMPEFLMWAFGM